MTTDEVRRLYLEFFKERDHTVVASDSLVPAGDPSLLFTGAGMNQFKDQFLGRSITFRRAASCQKCLRTGDIDNVGRTASHHTFFEMLGNFSFGDYFKREAVSWGWEFVTRVLGLPEDRLSVSVYQDDDEAFDIWNSEMGLPPEKIFRFGEHDNFWPADAPSQGPNGPCGPCSEIFYDQGADIGCGRPDCDPSCDCDRFVEIWNLVFTQFNRRDGGVLDPLPQTNIDTGMGLERTARILQGKLNNFEIDILSPIVQQVAAIAAVNYGDDPDTDRALRRITDHARAVAFAISDGALPSNEGRGYVVRRLLRRAELDGERLGVAEPFLFQIVPTVAELMKETYPDLRERLETVSAFVRNEEERFRRTLRRGLDLLEEAVEELPEGGVFPGEKAFVLYDTYGFPLELTREFLEERAFGFDEEGFERAAEKQREESRARTVFGDIFAAGPVEELKAELPPSEFVGYLAASCRAEVLAIITSSGRVPELSEGQEGILVFKRTPFYAESGGQVADTGLVRGKDAEGVVLDVQKSADLVLHRVRVEKGTFRSGEEISLEVDAARRLEIARHHTATHLLHRALRGLLGAHVQQSGSLVEPDRLRLDFTHFKALSPEELQQIEQQVNAWVMEDIPIGTLELPIEEAKKRGAIALFGEKYGDTVRMVEAGEVSRELCGGTHLDRTGKVGVFLIRREEAISAGVRRIEAVAGRAALDALKQMRAAAADISAALSVPLEEAPSRIEGLAKKVKDLEKQLKQARRKGGADVSTAVEAAEDVAGVSFLHHHEEGASANDLNAISDRLRAKLDSPFVLVLSSDLGKKVLLTVWVDKAITDRLSAVDLIEAASEHIRGGGGGKPERAQAGGKDPSGIPKAVEAVKDRIRAVLG